MWHKRTWVWIRQEWAYGQEHFRDGERRTPIVFENIEADAPRAVYVAMVDASSKHNLSCQVIIKYIICVC